jgi:DNA polymerase-1
MDLVSRPDWLTQPDCVFVFDVTAFLHRSLHVSYGDRVPVVPETDTAFVKHAGKMISNVVQALEIRQMVIALDSTEPSLRCDYYPSYKAERKAHAPVFAAQAPRFYDALRRAGAFVVGAPRYEADDVIASMMNGRDFPVCIVSSDKDLLQYVGADVVMYDAMKDVFLDATVCQTKFGVAPGQLADYIGLVGDSSDGIPGVPSFGPKTAARVIEKFGSLDMVYREDQRDALAATVTAKQLATLLKHESDAFLSRRLARPTIWADCPRLACETDGLRAPEPFAIRRATEIS